MTQALVVITKEFAGKEWSNTWCVTWPGTNTIFPTDQNLIDAGGGLVLDDTATDPSGDVASYQGDNYILPAIIGFERALTWYEVAFKNMYVTDGKKRVEGNPAANVFISANLDFNGNRSNASNSTQVYAGGVTLMLNRVPVGFNRRQGRLFMRTVLNEGDVSLKGAKLVDFTSQVERDAVAALVQNSLTASMLPNYFADGGDVGAESVYLSIPNYYNNRINPLDPQNGTLVGSTLIKDITMNGVVYRQVTKGRKRTTAPGA